MAFSEFNPGLWALTISPSSLLLIHATHYLTFNIFGVNPVDFNKVSSDFLNVYENLLAFVGFGFVLKIRLRNEVKYVGKGLCKKI